MTYLWKTLAKRDGDLLYFRDQIIMRWCGELIRAVEKMTSINSTPLVKPQVPNVSFNKPFNIGIAADNL